MQNCDSAASLSSWPSSSPRRRGESQNRNAVGANAGIDVAVSMCLYSRLWERGSTLPAPEGTTRPPPDLPVPAAPVAPDLAEAEKDSS